MLTKTYRRLATLAAIGALVGCANPPPPRPAAKPVVVVTPEPEPFIVTDWKKIVSPADDDRLKRIEGAWTEGLAEARKAGFTRQIRAEGALLDPNLALPRAALPPGSYRCRVVTLGKAERRGRAFAAYKPFFCFVDAEDALLIFTKQTGTERPAGRIWADGDDRHVFLGAMVLDNERVPRAYGDDPARDLAGIVQRVEPFRYRIAFPWPAKGSKLDVYELVPATPFPFEK